MVTIFHNGVADQFRKDFFMFMKRSFTVYEYNKVILSHGNIKTGMDLLLRNIYFISKIIYSAMHIITRMNAWTPDPIWIIRPLI